MQDIIFHPALMECRRLFLRDYEININIGVHEFEKQGEQRVILNVDLYIPLNLNTPSNDELDEVVDYDFMRETIKDLSSHGHIQLQETFCDEIVSAMLMHPKVIAARVSTAKPDVYPDCHSVGVEVFRMKKV
ncbi:dihydroneopterin aldolase [Polynucleobacter sp. TUM22923]|jgi:dihydroneopterin aldolase|uniref:dihydroneopterin aldolase n=1 Tax=Polynucleobacter sp. TUM22923 TaxID=3022126 RepID=UPI002572A7FF|nr:dihydroneopterin aldolase [Polynucleobacter sp. TUM22923]BDX22414.1 dihydroneopterin aldolase [Polynucleobacter sp. TUM22923]